MPPLPARRVRRAPRDGRRRGGSRRGSLAMLALAGAAAFPALGASDPTPNLSEGLIEHVDTVAVAESLRHGARAAEVLIAIPNSVTVPNPVTARLAAAPAPVPPPPPPPAPAPASGVWYQLAQCESGGDWAISHGTFEGGLQFMNSTWLAFGGGAYAQHAYDASPEAQIAIAEKVLAAAGGSYRDWPGCQAELGLP